MGRHEFPFKNHVCFIVNEVRDIKREPAPLLTKLNKCSPSANKIPDKQPYQSLSQFKVHQP